MRHLHKRIAKLHLAKGASFSKCMGDNCSKAPEREAIWADGRGRAWHCEKCHGKWVKENEDTEGENDWMPLDIVRERKVPNGVVGDKYGEYPKTAKDSRTGPGYNVGLFLPLPRQLSKKFPALGAIDNTPSHITFLRIGSVKDPADQARLMKVLREIFQRRWSQCKASLGGLEVFSEPDHKVVSVSVVFNKDMFALRQRIKKDLEREGFDLPNRHPEFKPHVTLKRIDLGDDYQGRVPRGTWGFDEMEIWGLPKVHKIKFGGDCKLGATPEINAAAVRAVMAKAEGKKEWGGTSVGLFIPLPKRLAKKFPSLGEEDTSPSHVTFLYIGDVKGEKEQKHLIDTLKKVHGKWWPEVTGTLDGLAHFEHKDKDRRVAHVQVDFDKDLSGMRHRVKQELEDGGITVGDSFPEYKPHVTLAYMPGIDTPDYDGDIPEGTWKFKGMEVWGLPKTHKIKFGPSFYKVSQQWLAKQDSK